MPYKNINWEELLHLKEVRDAFNDQETFKLRQERKNICALTKYISPSELCLKVSIKNDSQGNYVYF